MADTEHATAARSDFTGRVLVVGGGISGLAAAHRVRELAPAAEVMLLEAGDRLGGVIATDLADGFLLEQSADSFVTNLPWGVDLCRRVGLADELIATDERHRKATVVFRGRLEPVPEGFVLMAPTRLSSIATTPILSALGKARLLCEPFIAARRDGADESLAHFARRRLGNEVFERLVQPLVSGIYTADPEKLSVAAALPRFVEMERRHGSLTRGAIAEARQRPRASDGSGARYSLFVAPRHGMGSLVEAVAARLGHAHMHLNSPVERVERDGTGFVAHVAGREAIACDRLIVATPAPSAARLARPLDGELADLLSGIEYASSAVALVGYERGQIAGALDSFGFVVPAVEKRRVLAASFSSVKFAGRAADGRVLVRVFLGGAAAPEMVELGDDELARIVMDELGSLIGARGAPVLFQARRWRESMPQYHVGHLARVERIMARARAIGIELAGNAYHGVGVPYCVRSGERAAERALGIKT